MIRYLNETTFQSPLQIQIRSRIVPIQSCACPRGVLNATYMRLQPRGPGRAFRVPQTLKRRWSRALLRLGLRPTVANDLTWFELQFEPEIARRRYHIPLPSWPPEEVQLRFTGRTYRENLQQAFSFYTYVRDKIDFQRNWQPKVLDFGGGWGRIARLFLRDTPPDRIWICDCLTDSVAWLKQTRNPCHIIQNGTLPPVKDLPADFDLIYAFSVFSHLCEAHLRAWLEYLRSCLAPGGFLVITTRGRQFLRDHVVLAREQPQNYIVKALGPPPEVQALYSKGEFQFYATGGGGELTSDFYGEAIVPREYFEKHYAHFLTQFTDEVPQVDQTVAVFRKPGF